MLYRHLKRQSRFLILFAMSCLLLACSHQHSNVPVQHLFATIPETAAIVVYPVTATGSDRPEATIKEQPPDKPVDVSVDLLGEIFIANENGNVQAYGGRDLHYVLIHRITGAHTRIQHPTAIVTDIAGSFYVADPANAQDPARVEWFSAGQNGNVPPNRVISGPHTGITTPTGLALDGSGRLFVADERTNKVLVFDSDADGDAIPIAILAGLKSPARLVVDQLLDVYVTNARDNSVSMFVASGPQSWQSNTTITCSSLRDPAGVAVDSNGRIAVGSVGGILFFPPSSSRAVEPVVNLRGPSPMNVAGLFIR